MVYYNNALSVPPLILLTLVTGELPGLLSRPYPFWSSPAFYVVVLMGALVGFGVSFASIWCMSRTSATLYSLTGSMNKVVVAVVGVWLFQERATPVNLVSIALGLAAGILFVFAKTGHGPSRISHVATGAGPLGAGVGVPGPGEGTLPLGAGALGRGPGGGAVGGALADGQQGKA